MKKIILSLFLSATCLVGMSQKAQISLPITWDDTVNVDYTVIGFGSDTAYLAADPTNASNIVLEVIKPPLAQTYAGVVLGNDSLSAAIPFSAGNTVLRARVYAPVVGTPIRMKVENESNAGIFVEAQVNTTVSGWDTLSFDFASQVAGTPAINFANVYDKIAVFFNFGNSPTVSETYFIDYVEFSGGGSSGPSKAQIDLPINWDDTANVSYAVIDFGGNVSTVVVDPTNASNLVLQSDKPSSANTWAGTSLGSSLATAINFSASSTVIQARIWSAASGIPVLMKVEDQTNAAIFVETLANTSRVGWDTLSFDFSNPSPNNQALNFANTYDKASLFFNFNVVPSATETYYTDDVWFGAAAVPSKAQIDLPINWNDTANVNYAVTAFGGNISTLVVDPTNASNLVLQVDKPTTAQSWAGTTLGSPSLATAIPFASSNTVMQARVWSAASGIPVLMKVEDQTNAGIFVETLANTSQIGWDTLTFDFSNPSPNNQALNFANTYDVVSVFFNFNVVPSATETYYLDNVSFGNLSTGITEYRSNPTFTVYPNPANDFVTIDASLLEDVNQIVVTNSIGQVVLQKNVSALDNKIDVSNFDNGVYFMILNSELGRKTSKFMVSK